MGTVDNRAVEMSFDNAAFERKIATTIKSLETLQTSLDLANATKGLEDLSRTSKNFNLGGMNSAVEGVSKSFLALSTVAITVLSNITTKAFDAGTRLAKSLSLDQIISGFQEYETNMNSIQTILANTKQDGTNLQQVNDALDQLNTYADKTIYNFGEMARNIGTFTAAGVDLDTSVQSIKGIANLAAISGSNSQQAGTAMYQLSQAISTGTLRLQDWNSVVNAGMGGQVFQTALFETGKTMGTITDVPMDQTFEQWTDAGNTFRSSLESNWLTADVLTQTLSNFTGEMTDAQLTAVGYTEEQIAQIKELGQTGVDAATKVRTLTQLIDTVKEAIGSGWSTSFRIIFGDFEQATELFTGVSDAIGSMVSESSDARNELLQGWSDLGGRAVLIEGLKSAFESLSRIMAPIKEAFRDIFPAVTSQRLFEMTHAFKNFLDLTEVLTPVVQDKLKRAFRGLFAALEIGWEIIKQGVGFVKDLIGSFTEGKDALGFFANLGDSITDLNARLVEGGGIAAFFEKLGDVIRNPLPYLEELKDKFIDFFQDLDLSVQIPDVLGGAFDRLTERFEGLGRLADRIGDIWRPFSNAFSRIGEVLGNVWTVIRDWFKNLGSEMAAAAEPGDFDAALDVINVGLLGGIGLLIKNFIDKGFGRGFFGRDIFEGVSDSLEELTGVLEAMQADIKANAILKIAGALALLTASVAVLAAIDSAALTKALTAVSVGFGQLLTSFAVLNKLAVGPKGATSFTILSTGLVVLSGALLILALAVKVLSTMNWEELSKGLTGVTGLLVILTGASKLLSQNSAGMITSGVGMIAIAVALNILALAVKQFANMDWEEMGKGLAGIAGGLVAIGLGMQLMPSGMVTKGAGLILVAVALNILALAVKQFSGFSWKEMGKGFAGIAGGLVAIGLAMQLMPATLPITASGLLLVSVSLLIIAKAMKEIATLSWEELAKGLTGIAGALLILAVATTAMSGAIPGAIAIGIVSVSLLALVEVLKEMSKLSLKELGKGLLGIASVLAVLGLSALVLAPLIPALLGLSVAMLALGAGFALFGIGANLTAAAFAVLAKAGDAGIGVLLTLIDALIKRIPALLKALAIGLIELGQVFLEAAPVLIEQLGVVFKQILVTLRDLLPEFTLFMLDLIDSLVSVVIKKSPDVIQAGFQLLVDFLKGLRDNIPEITVLVAEIIAEFLSSLAKKAGDLVTAGLELLLEFVKGIIDNLDEVVAVVGDLVATFLAELGNLAADIVEGGVDALVNFLSGITDNFSKVTNAIGDLVTTMIAEVAKLHARIVDAGFDALLEFLSGIGDNLIEVVHTVGDIVTEFITAVGDETNRIIDAGTDTIIAFLEGIGDNSLKIANAALDVIVDFINGIADAIETHTGELQAAGKNLAFAIADGMTLGLASKTSEVVGAAGDLAGKAIGKIKSIGGIFSPSRVTRYFGEMLGLGLVKGLDSTSGKTTNSAATMIQRVKKTISDSLDEIAFGVNDTMEFSPIITPVLDLSNVRKEAGKIAGITSSSQIAAGLSYSKASDIASTEVFDNESTTTPSVSKDIKFEQNIYSPKALSLAEMYRQTRSQIVVAKEELSI